MCTEISRPKYDGRLKHPSGPFHAQFCYIKKIMVGYLLFEEIAKYSSFVLSLVCYPMIVGDTPDLGK